MDIDIPYVFSYHSNPNGFEFTIGPVPLVAALALAFYFLLF